MRTPRRAQVIIDLIRENNYKRIAEIGVCKGETAMPVMEACELDYYLLVDPAFNDSSGLFEMAAKYPAAELVQQTSKQVAKREFDYDYDLIFIDAIHTYEAVSEDIRLWTPKVRVGGIICGHDYDNKRFPGVRQAVDEYFGTGRILTKPVRACKVWTVKLMGELEKNHLIGVD